METDAGTKSYQPIRTSDFRIYTTKIDYENNWTNEVKFQLGFKGSFNQSNTLSKISEQINGSWIELDEFNRDDDLNENILAGYTSLQKNLNSKWEGEIGIRFEHYTFELASNKESNDLSIQYDNFFPVIRVNHTLDSIRSLQLVFNRRTTRANYWMLAGFYTLLDPSLFGTSNTNLRPAFSNSIRLNYKHRNILTSLAFTRTTGLIAFYNTVDKPRHLQITTPVNYDRADQLLLSFNFPIYITSWWETSWNLAGSYNFLKDESNRPLPFEHSIISYNFQLNNFFSLGKHWTANFSGWYMSPFIDGDQVKFLRHRVNLGIRKKFNNQSSLSFNIQDITRTSGIIEWEYDQPELEVSTFGNNDASERVFRLSYTLNFGNDQLKAKRNRTTSSEEERNRM